MTYDKMQLWPYEELKIERGQQYSEYFVSTPWLVTRIDTNAQGRDIAELVISDGKNTLKPEFVPHYSRLLQALVYTTQPKVDKRQICYIV